MPTDTENKHLHELAIATIFLEHLAKEGVVATDLRPGDEGKGEPDAVCNVAGRDFGIEVVDLWLSNADAASAWGLARQLQRDGTRVTAPGAGPSRDLYDHPSGNLIVAVAEKRLGETIKAYGIPTWLILYGGGIVLPLHGAGEGPAAVKLITKPAPAS